ncbi:MAG: TrkH family potassium uptake protein [Moraxellaceae bacterium]|nr:TrkH family potassium uptake protein [Moraxellaceae bacterium]
MSVRQICRILGILMLLYSVTLLPPMLLSLWLDDGGITAFSVALIEIVALGMLAWWPNRHQRDELTPRDGFVVVTLFWVVFGTIGAFPFLLSPHHALPFVDALFESFSGLTGTGSSVMADLDNIPPSLNYYRHQLCWLGGMGIVVLAIAIMPMLGVGGMQLYRAESPGVVKDKLTPRITETAKALWLIYVGLTLLCLLCFRLASMSWFDAVCHAFSTIATAGFSTHGNSIGHFNSPLIELITAVFMFAGAINFGLHFMALRRGRPIAYWRDPELRFFAGSLLLLIALVSVMLWSSSTLAPLQALRHGLFMSTSLLTTTGFSSTDFTMWPGILPFLVVSASVMGGMAGSTASGVKPLRMMLALKHSLREISRLLHPNGVFALRLGRKVVHYRVIDAVWGFLTLYLGVFVIMMWSVMATGVDFVTAYGAVVCSLNNAGAGLGAVASSYASLNDAAKLILMGGMVLGRLEIFTLLVLLSPAFWRR